MFKYQPLFVAFLDVGVIDPAAAAAAASFSFSS